MTTEDLAALLSATARQDRAAFEQLYRASSATKSGEPVLKDAADKMVFDIPTLAISLEPVGGSSTGAATGPVLYTEPCKSCW